MDVRAIILVGAPTTIQRTLDGNGASFEQLAESTISGTPMALLPLFGRSLVLRVAEQLIEHGVDNVSIVSTRPAMDQKPLPSQVCWKN